MRCIFRPLLPRTPLRLVQLAPPSSLHLRTMSSQGGPGKRDYGAAIEALNTLQSNAAVIEAIRKSGGKMNDLALPEMREYWTRLGYELSDLNKLNVIHITGTKGKGSTAAFCASLLAHAPLEPSTPRRSVGLYTSPHLVFVRERIRLDGKPIDEETFAKYFWDVWDKLEKNPERAHAATPLRPVYFRFLTLLAMHIFLSLGVKATILEVGIGGTYDSTNIVPRPLVCGISSLGIDHVALLGNTIELIAAAKAGIYKKDAVALSVAQKESALEVVRNAAKEAEVREFIELPPVSSDAPLRSIALGLPGAHQASNAQLALGLVRSFLSTETGHASFPLASSTSISSPSSPQPSEWEEAALRNATWPGRCQVVPSSDGLTYFLDGAHTTDSLLLAAKWYVSSEAQRAGGKSERVLVFNCTHGRSAEELLGAVLQGVKEAGAEDGLFDRIIFTTNTTYTHGSSGDQTAVGIDPNDLAALTVQNELKAAWLALCPADAARITIVPSIQDAMAAVRSGTEGTEKNTHTLVTGSLLLVGGVMSHLRDEGALDDALLSVRSQG